MTAPPHTSPSEEGEVGAQSAPGGVAAEPPTPPSTALRVAASPAEAGEGKKPRRVRRTVFAKRMAKNMRRKPTNAEKRLWYFLHKKQLDGLRFRRQEPIGNFVADFVCPALRLVIEVDGGQHGVRTAKDAARTAWLQAQGYSVVRFWNTEVMDNIEGVLATIREEAQALQNAPPPHTSPSSEGEVGARSAPGGGGAAQAAHRSQCGSGRREAAPPSTARRAATSPSEEGEG